MAIGIEQFPIKISAAKAVAMKRIASSGTAVANALLRRNQFMPEVIINGARIGEGSPCYVIAEIGINHNGDIDIARRLVDVAAIAGCQAVKFQKRTLEIVYGEAELARPRESPFGKTNGDLKRGLEFGLGQYWEMQRYCRDKSMTWFASCWDERSVDFIEQFNPPAYKIASACLTDEKLLAHHRRTGRPLLDGAREVAALRVDADQPGDALVVVDGQDRRERLFIAHAWVEVGDGFDDEQG